MALNLNLRVSYIHTCASRLEEGIGKFLHIYGSCFMLQIDPSGWKGYVSNGLGADISLPHCLATGIWNLAPKATSGPKSRGASFGTTLWRHVQRYCAQFLLFMLIYGNLFLWGYKWNRQKPPLSCPRLFLWTLESFQNYCMEEIIKKRRLLVVRLHDFQKCEKWSFLNILQRPYIVWQNYPEWTILWMK